MDPSDRARWSRTNRSLSALTSRASHFRRCANPAAAPRRLTRRGSSPATLSHPDGVFPTNSGEFVGTARSNDSPNVNARSLSGVIRYAAATAAPSPSRSSTRGCRVGPDECGSSAANIFSLRVFRGVVGRVGPVLVRQRQLGDCPPRLAVLHQQRTRGVRQVIFVAYLRTRTEISASRLLGRSAYDESQGSHAPDRRLRWLQRNQAWSDLLPSAMSNPTSFDISNANSTRRLATYR